MERIITKITFDKINYIHFHERNPKNNIQTFCIFNEYKYEKVKEKFKKFKSFSLA